MILRYLTAALAFLGLAWTQDTAPVSGQVGAENSTTPTAKEGDHTIHYVTVGKATNNFYVWREQARLPKSLLTKTTAELNQRSTR